MQFSGFDWDDGNLDKCQKHGMTIADIESVFRGVVVVFPDKLNPQGQDRMRAIGTTTTGRKAFIVYTWRHIGQNSRLIRPISARFMHQKEVDHYEKAYPNLQ